MQRSEFRKGRSGCAPTTMVRSFSYARRSPRRFRHFLPSVLLHRTVPSEISGVMVTTDLELGTHGAITVSASEGVSAVVDGGAPETLVLQQDGTIRLLASSRTATRKLIPPPPEEGVVIMPSAGRDPLLGDHEIAELRGLASDVIRKMPPTDVPWDTEFGFSKGRAYLLQIRPLRASKSAVTNPFLLAIDAKSELPLAPLDLSEDLP